MNRMENERYPDWRKGATVGVITGIIGAVATFGICCFVAHQSETSCMSLSWTFQPWWRLRNWVFSGIIGSSLAGVMCLLEAVHPRWQHDQTIQQRQAD